MTSTPCLLLDIGGVLELTPPTGWVRRWEEWLGLPPGGIGERMGDVWEAGTVGRVREDEVYAQVAARLELGPPQVDAFVGDLWTEYLGTPNEELIAHVRGLRGTCRLGILSNSFVGARERETAAYRFDELVEHIVYSHETGFLKPDPRAFAAACAALGVAPGDCLLIDDAAVNVEAARALRMQAHLFDGNPGAIARITAHLTTGSGPGPRR